LRGTTPPLWPPRRPDQGNSRPALPAVPNRGVTNVYFFVGRAAHPFYREQFRFAPPGFRYLPSHPGLERGPSFGRALSRQERLVGKISRQTKRVAAAALAAAGHVRRVKLGVPHSVSLIHSAQFLVQDSDLPYVVDFEDVHVFTLYQRLTLDRDRGKARLRDALADPRCRHLLPWTEKARQGVLATLGEASGIGVASRTTTVLPAIRPTASDPRRWRPGPLRVAFIGVRFFEKGGVEAAWALRRARTTHDVELHMVTFAPPEWRRRLATESGVYLYTSLSRDEMGALFARCDVLLFPTHTDTLGWVVLEALAAAMPVVATDHHALPELVEDGVSGLLFPHENSLFGPDGRPRYPLFLPPWTPRPLLRALRSPSDRYVDAIAERLTRLADERDAYEHLSEGALASVRSGRFSSERRRAQLRDVYARALECPQENAD
jgi:glycosyltransferase involved in cell wall biosynthesis